MDEKQIVKIWLPIENYEDNYLVSNDGDIKNINTQKLLKFHIRNGYYAVCLCTNNVKHTYNVHRIVAKHFVQQSNQPGANHVNHINGNKLDNRSCNLEFVTPKQNTLHAIQNNLSQVHCKKVGQFSDGKLVKAFNSIKEAANELGISAKKIPSCCRNRIATVHGFQWKYLDDNLRSIDFRPLYFDDIEGVVIDNYPNYKITRDGKVFSKLRRDFLIAKTYSSGLKSIKLCNNGKNKDFYISALVKKYFPNTNSQVHLNDGNNIQS